MMQNPENPKKVAKCVICHGISLCICLKTFICSMGLSQTCAFHSEQQKHCDDGKEGANSIGDDELQGVVVWNEQDVQDCGSRKVSCKQATCVWKD